MTTSRLAVLALLLAGAANAAAPPASRPRPGALTFEQHVRPILRTHCTECHGEGSKPRGGLDLRLRRFAVAGGDSGPAIVPGKSAASLLLARVRAHEMPPGKLKLAPDEIDRIERWIAGGAATLHAEPGRLPPGRYLSEDDLGFWSFQPIRRPPVPTPRRAAVAVNAIDAFLLAKLEAVGLSFAPPADRYTLLRRVTLDLTGLPPTLDEIDRFVRDRSPGAYERVVERLLSSPAYGERWGRHWLDVAGYADSHGGTGPDPVRAYAWKYRDYVIRSLNHDLPLDRFITEQIAGDELAASPPARLSADDLDRLTATGFLRTAADGTATAGADVKVAANQTVADTVQIVSTALLGLTMHCAQCHNHRYDPITQEDYYRLRAVFEPAYDVKAWRSPQGRLVSLQGPGDRQKAQRIEQDARRIDAERLTKAAEHIERTFQKQLARVPENLRADVEKAYRTPPAKRTAAHRKLLREHPSVNVSIGSLYLYDRKAADDLARYADRAAKLRATRPVEDFIDALTEVPGKVPATHLFHRGDPEQPRQTVPPDTLAVLANLGLGPIPAKDLTRPTTGRRLAFARQLVSGKHPLTARVLVNRVWMHHFGKGIVATPGDFGTLGERPTHPELLDFLAGELMRNWSLKRLHRLIVTSAAYRQSSRGDARGWTVDPDARLLWRMPLRRLEAETVRDAMLAVAGRINRRPFGPPVPVTPDSSGQIVLGLDTRDGAGRPRGAPGLVGEDFYRRSVYVQVRRSMTLSVLETFDAPVLSPSCERRTFSTVAPQSLFLMNSDFMVRTAGAFAARVRREAASLPDAQVRLAWRLAYGRPADQAQVSGALAYLAGQTALFRAKKSVRPGAGPEEQAMATFCQALLSSNPFLYVE
jgi:mono/diheme cytochrome c family protein